MSLTRPTAVLAAFACSLLATSPALAADRGEATPLSLPPVDQPAGSSGGGSLVRTFVGLAIVLAVIYGLYWVLRQVKASREGAASGNGLESVASVPLGPGRSLHLVRTGDEVVLLGVSEHSVVPIRSYREPEARAAGLLDAPTAGTVPSPPAAAPAAALAVLAGLVDGLRRRTVRG